MRPAKPASDQVRAKFTNPGTATTIYLTTNRQIVVHRRLGRNAGGPVKNAEANVDTSGNLATRTTATRNVATGGLLGQKKVDAREVFLTIVGDDWSVSEKIPPIAQGRARKFAAEVNAAAR